MQYKHAVISGSSTCHMEYATVCYCFYTYCVYEHTKIVVISSSTKNIAYCDLTLIWDSSFAMIMNNTYMPMAPKKHLSR